MRSTEKKTNVTVYIEVYNEESRIESCLKSFAWADKIVVFDKNSSDKTREIARKYTSEVILVPYCDGSGNIVKNISNHHSSSHWYLFPTASSLMHPRLADEIIKLTSSDNFDYDVIGMPYGMYSMGIRSSKSPFHTPRKYTLIRKSKLVLSHRLHNEISYDSNNVFDMPLIDDDAVLYHCTHKDAETFFMQTLRYVKYESKQDTDIRLRKAFFDIWKAFIHVTLRRRSFFLGWNGVVVSLSFVTYYMIRFIYIWDERRGDGNKTYSTLRNKVDALWDSMSQKEIDDD